MHQPTIESIGHLPLSGDLRLEGDDEARWPRHLRLALFIGFGSLSWGIVIGAGYYLIEFVQRLF